MADAAAFDGFDEAEGAGGEPREEGSRMENGLVGMTGSSALALFLSYLETTEQPSTGRRDELVFKDIEAAPPCSIGAWLRGGLRRVPPLLRSPSGSASLSVLAMTMTMTMTKTKTKTTGDE